MNAEHSACIIVPPRASTVVLIGAGFSMEAGLPITSQLVRRGRERLKPAFLNSLDALAVRVLEEPIGEDLEAVLTRLQVLELYSKKHDLRMELLPLKWGIAFLMWAALRLSSPPPSLYDTFLRRLGSDVAFAGLNYDLVLETVFRRNQRAWHYPLQGEVRFGDDLRYHDNFYVSSGQNPQSTPYLKLHGSYNWHYCWRCDYFRIVQDEWFGVSGFHLPRHSADPLWVTSRGTLMCGEDECVIRSGPGTGQAALQPLIIPPSRVKEYDRAPIRRHWAFFDLLLWQAKELIIVGTSLRNEDILLLNSLSLLKLKNRNLKRVVVIDHREEIAKRVGMLTELETTWYPNLETYVSNG
jgi:hypothetical protein